MSDRQTPESVMDRARACILEHRGERFFARIFMPEIDVRLLADEVQPDSLTDLGRERRRLNPAEHRDKVVSAARKGELYLWGVQVVIDDETPEIRCDAASQSPMKSRLHALADAHASIVRPDGTVGGISRDPLPFWKNCEGAARGAEECRADQHAGVANSVQAAQGCRLAAGASMKRADLCPLGTADESGFMTAEDKARAAAETVKALRQGHDLRALAIRLQRGMGYPFRQLMAGIRWIAGAHAQSPKPRFRYDWLLKKWVSAETVDAVAIGGPLHGQRISIAATADGLSHRVGRGQVVRYVRHDFTHRIPCPQRYTVLVEERTELPPTWEMRRLASSAKSLRYGQLLVAPYA